MLNSKFKILIVDDIPLNIKVVGKLLKENNFDIAFANSGKEALQKAQHYTYDLILLDVTMPEMDGYQVCRELKKDDRTKEIPVIFLTARVDAENILEGFNAGAVDYIAKPFSAVELLARVKNHLTIKSQKKIIENMNQILEKKVQEKTTKLRDANQRLMAFDKLKSEFLTLINHELRTPLTGIKGFIELLEKTLSTHKQLEYVTTIKTQIYKLEKITESALIITTLKADKYKMNLQCVTVGEIIRSVVNQSKSSLKMKNINIITNMDERKLMNVDFKLFTNCIYNILQNAITVSKPNDNINISAFAKNNFTIFQIHDDGPGFSESKLKYLFELFSNNDIMHHSEGLGLGLAVCKLITEAHNGKIKIYNHPKGGAAVELSIPDDCQQKNQED